MITYRCDNCGERLRGIDDCVGYIDEDIWVTCDHGWVEHKGKHYCPKCYEVDDNDNIILKEQ